MNKLGWHWHPYHIDDRVRDALRAWQPPTLEIDEHRIGDPFFIEWLFATLPAATFVFRDVPLSNSAAAMLADPAGLARAHAAHWEDAFGRLAGVKGWEPGRVVVCGVNEPPVELDSQVAATSIYYSTFLDELQKRDIAGGALRLSVGWPRNTGTDTRVVWEDFAPVLAAIRRGRHVLLLNEYWGTSGPADPHWLGWHADRLGQCPWDVDIIVTECGLDQHAVDPATPNTGWHRYLSAEAYLAQLGWYHDRMRADPRVIGINIYTVDFGNNIWATFDVRPILEQLLAHVQAKKSQPAPLQLPYPRYPANVTNPLPPAGGGTPEGDLAAALISKAKSRQLISPNPTAALERAAWGDGYASVLGNEFDVSVAGQAYRGQLFYRRVAEGEAAERVYYAHLGDWGNVKHMEVK